MNFFLECPLIIKKMMNDECRMMKKMGSGLQVPGIWRVYLQRSRSALLNSPLSSCLSF